MIIRFFKKIIGPPVLFFLNAPYILAVGRERVFDPPLTTRTFQDFLRSILKGVTPIAALFAAVAIIILGLRLIIAASSGNEQELKEAKKLFLWVLVGSALIVGASVLADAIFASFGRITQ